MPGRPPRLHLPFARWPAADQSLWQRAMDISDDPFGDAAGARLAKATSASIIRAGGVSSAFSRLRSLRPWRLPRGTAHHRAHPGIRVSPRRNQYAAIGRDPDRCALQGRAGDDAGA